MAVLPVTRVIINANSLYLRRGPLAVDDPAGRLVAVIVVVKEYASFYAACQAAVGMAQKDLGDR